MKYFELKAFCEYLQRFNEIKHVKRVENNTLKVEFQKNVVIFFDMTRGNATAYTKTNTEDSIHPANTKKDFKSPFDVLLLKKFTASKIEKIYLKNDDKVLCFEVSARSSYKKEIVTLQFEFTGKNTNVIILDEHNTILEALRHIDESSSSRVIKVGIKLDDLPRPNFKFEEKDCIDIEQTLANNYLGNELKELENTKTQKISVISKQKEKLQSILNSLQSIDVLEEESQELYKNANIILSNLHNIKSYEKEATFDDFDGGRTTIKFDKNYPTPSRYADFLFKSAKKLKQKKENQYLEYENLSQKIEFFERLAVIIKNAKTIQEIEFYLPKKDKNIKKTKKMEPYQSFFIDGFKIMLGRDERENIFLLENSKASDFWFHLQGQPSSHVIVQNTKKDIPDHIIEEAAKICAKFSSDNDGVFVIDFTQRRNVKIQTKANVLYNPYSTVVVKI